MLFNDGPNGRKAQEWRDQVHPDLRTLLISFERWTAQEGLQGPLLTDLCRSPAEQIAIYVRFWRKLLEAMQPGPRHMQVDPEGDGTFRPMDAAETKKARELAGLVAERIAAEEQNLKVTLGTADREALALMVLEEEARKKFTWHWVRCAADMRTIGGGAPRYNPAELARVAEWFQARCKQPQWELLIHDVHGPHLHVARRDFKWRAEAGVP